jgi:hypothetical protein
MSMTLPHFTSLWSGYPNTSDWKAVLNDVGGHVKSNADDYLKAHPNLEFNTCVIRMSRAFNYSGQPIPGPSTAKAYGMHVVSGQDKRWYAVRVQEFEKYLRGQYGSPLSFKMGTADLAKLVGKQGIIEFVAHFSDATGHFDLWDGNTCRYHEYFARSTQVNLWPC